MKRIRKPDDDLAMYLVYNEDIFTIEDIKNIHAEIAGHNEESSWFWVIELKDKRFLLTEASCSISGWDASSRGESKVARSKIGAVKLAPELDYGRHIRRDLLAQIKGELAFGLEVTP